MSSYVSLNGTLVAEDQATFAIRHSGLETGAGVFTVMRLHDGRIESLQAHIQRLAVHAVQHGLNVPVISPEYFCELVRKNQALQGTYPLKALIIPTRLESTGWGKTTLVKIGRAHV